MPIPESQLEIWSHQGSITQSSATYHSLRNVLTQADTPYANKDYSVFLQGSYGNDTNIYAESDVDLVISLNDCWFSDLSALEQQDIDRYNGAFGEAAYTHVDFKRDVLAVLTRHFGSDVASGAKAIAVAASGGRRRADVIAAIQFRRYHRFNGIYDQVFDKGICFLTSAGERIVNYPKQHATNLTRKHQATDNWLKPMIRVVKNIRSKLVEDGMLTGGIAPSYYLEGLLYNVPTKELTASYQDCFANTVNWLQTEADKESLLCANEQYYLLRDNSHNCWPQKNAEAFISAAVQLWHDW